jgi:hypothetical protein
MPAELRRLVFSHKETTEALLKYGQQENIPFPKGKMIRAKYAGGAEYELHSMKGKQTGVNKNFNVDDQNRAIIVTFFDEETFEHKFFNLTADFVSAALIGFCIDHKIMLPRDARKSLDLTEFNVCMDVVKDNDGNPSQGAGSLSLEE